MFLSKEKSSLVGWAMSLHPGSLKRSAVMAEIARESKRHKTKESRIDFGCKFPLSGGLPAELERGFQQLQENSKHMCPRQGSPTTTGKRIACWKRTRESPRLSSSACWR